MNDPTPWIDLAPWLGLAIPLTFGLAALFVAPASPLRRAQRAATLALGLAAAAAFATVLGGPSSLSRMPVVLDAVSALLLPLVCTLALAIVRYSRSYLRGEPGLGRYTRWLMATLAAVTVVLTTQHLLVFALAWVGTSLSLHQLLTFYDQRTPALLAAHKKFLVSRLADLCLFGALGLVYAHVGSLRFDALQAYVAAPSGLPSGMQLAALLFALAAALKSAQLPFHGWLTQVMEAPTPVSALLHAGVVNLGGVLMLRLAPLMVQAQVAQLFLVVLGTATAVVAATIMSTRVSIKVALAWSTIAQMGFMLMQCGLGAYHLALLHLVAHSLYKAHAFLGAGSTVHEYRVQVMAGDTASPRLAAVLAWGLAGAAALAGMVLVVSRFGVEVGMTDLALFTMFGLSFAPLVARSAGSALGAARTLLYCAGLATLYVGAHALFAPLAPTLGAPVSLLGPAVAFGGFAGLFVLNALLESAPTGRLARALHPHLFAGLYLDELFTRVTFRVWPPRLPQRHEARPLTVAEELEG